MENTKKHVLRILVAFGLMIPASCFLNTADPELSIPPVTSTGANTQAMRSAFSVNLSLDTLLPTS
jgi:hypothetical protein